MDRETLKALGWSDDLIKAALEVSGRIEKSTPKFAVADSSLKVAELSASSGLILNCSLSSSSAYELIPRK